MSDQRTTFNVRLIFMMFIFVVLVPFLTMIISWKWDWWQAWVYAIVCIAGFAVSRYLANKRNPDLLEERSKYGEQKDAKSWDKVLSPLVSLGGALIPIAAGLDALLGPSAAFSLPVEGIALGLILVGYIWGAYALIENRFFSGMVRIQRERGHRVVSTGPYHWMRHPGYAGAILTYLATPFFLDSWWTLLPAVCLSILIVVRTSLEDKTLQEELPGYNDYSKKTCYRLFPGVW